MSRTNFISNREYIGDVITSSTAAAFKLDTFIVQPGNGTTFPWLNVIAQNYEQYKFHGIIFEYRSTSGDTTAALNTALGTVILATDYNVNAKPYTSKQIMENSQYAQSSKGSLSQVHQIQTSASDRPHDLMFVRTGALTGNDNIKWYDFVNFQIATVGFQGTSVNVGELWVSYVVEFFKPQIPNQIGGNLMTYVGNPLNTTVTGVNPFGALGTQASAKGSLTVTVPNAFTLVVSGLTPGNLYVFKSSYTGGSTVHTIAWALAAPTAASGWTAGPNIFSGVNFLQYPAAGETSVTTGFNQAFTATLATASFSVLQGTMVTTVVGATQEIESLDSSVV